MCLIAKQPFQQSMKGHFLWGRLCTAHARHAHSTHSAHTMHILQRERSNPDVDHERDVCCAGRDGLPAVEAEGGRAGRLAARGGDIDVDGVFNHRDGGGSRRLASCDARRLWPGCLGEGDGEGDRTRYSLSLDVDMKV